MKRLQFCSLVIALANRCAYYMPAGEKRGMQNGQHAGGSASAVLQPFQADFVLPTLYASTRLQQRACQTRQAGVTTSPRVPHLRG